MTTSTLGGQLNVIPHTWVKENNIFIQQTINFIIIRLMHKWS